MLAIASAASRLLRSPIVCMEFANICSFTAAQRSSWQVFAAISHANFGCVLVTKPITKHMHPCISFIQVSPSNCQQPRATSHQDIHTFLVTYS